MQFSIKWNKYFWQTIWKENYFVNKFQTPDNFPVKLISKSLNCSSNDSEKNFFYKFCIADRIQLGKTKVAFYHVR